MGIEIHEEYVSRETFEEVEWYFQKYIAEFKQYARQIIWWNNKFNLVSRSLSETAILEHVRHSISLCITESFWKATNIIDAGTGSGLPGLPLSIIHDDCFFELIDNNSKKVVAVNQMIRSLNLDRVETFDSDIYQYEPKEKSLFVSKHAFKLNDILPYLIKSNYESFLFLKGSDYKNELIDVDADIKLTVYNFNKATHLSIFKNKFILEFNYE